MEAFKIGQHYDQAFEEMSQKEWLGELKFQVNMGNYSL